MIANIPCDQELIGLDIAAMLGRCDLKTMCAIWRQRKVDIEMVMFAEDGMGQVWISSHSSMIWKWLISYIASTRNDSN
jgi:hypothetical protein